MLRVAGKATAVCGLAGTAWVITDDDKRDCVVGVVDGGGRFYRAVFHSAITAADYKVGLVKLEIGSPEYESKKKIIHQRAADRLLRICRKHGGVYTKFGQHLASLNHVLPKEFTETLKALQDRNPSVSLAKVEKAIESEFNATIGELFREFDSEAIAAASLAQVHRAVTKTGKEVAVKVQYPGLVEQVSRDMATLQLLGHLLAIIFPEYEYTWLLPDFAESLGLELDFVQEGVNGERIACMVKNRTDVLIPHVHWEYTTHKVLTMDFIRGAKISDRDTIIKMGLSPLKVADTVMSLFGQMIFWDGFIHSDPHPGNMMVIEKTQDSYGERKKTHQVVLLDHGMYRRLDPKLRTDNCKLWKAFMTRDTELGMKTSVDLGLPAERYDALSLIFTWRPSETTASLGKRISDEERKSLKTKYTQIASPEAVNEFLQALPRDLIFVFRTTDLLRGLNKDLGGTSMLRLLRFGEEAVKGLRLPIITPSDCMSAHVSNPESQFQEYLKSKNIKGPDTLDINMSHASVNRLVKSVTSGNLYSNCMVLERRKELYDKRYWIDATEGLTISSHFP